MDKDQLMNEKQLLERMREENNKGRDLEKFDQAMQKATTVEEAKQIIEECQNVLGTIPVEFKQKLRHLQSQTFSNKKIVDLGYKEKIDYQDRFQALYRQYQEAQKNQDQQTSEAIIEQMQDLGFNPVDLLNKGMMKR